MPGPMPPDTRDLNPAAPSVFSIPMSDSFIAAGGAADVC
jgi:hypothetical protein